jgi:hypothetical protein
MTALKRHLTANLKKCWTDSEVVSAVAGFCVTDSFVSGERHVEDETTAAALSVLDDQIGSLVDQKPKDDVVVRVIAKKAPAPVQRQPIIIRNVQLRNGVQGATKTVYTTTSNRFVRITKWSGRFL